MTEGGSAWVWRGRHWRVRWLVSLDGRVAAAVRPHASVGSLWTLPSEAAVELLEALSEARAAVRSRSGAGDCEIRWLDRSSAEATLEIVVTGIDPAPLPGMPPHSRSLVRGEADGLLAHLKACFPSAARVDIAVAFVMDRGVERIRPYLEDLLQRGGRLRLLTGDYFGVTEPDGLERLLDLEGERELRVFESGGVGFHPKAYLFHRGEAADPDVSGSGVAFVGSSNLSARALGDGVEWNYRVVGQRDHAGFLAVAEGFEELFRHPRTRELDHDWIAGYRRRRPAGGGARFGVEPEWEPPPPPNVVQQEALRALERVREDGSRAGLVVLATGLGKTWLSAFDSRGFERVLFVAHREEILRQALATYRRIRPEARLGMFTGKEKDQSADVLFASVQTLGRLTHLRAFDPECFDYIVVDEFHHAAARTYRNLIEHFEPRFLLGLTATPERTDEADLLGLCGDLSVFRCDLGEGVRRGLLCPFRYRGVPDDVDYAQIPWRSSRFDEASLTEAWATRARARNAFEQLQKHGGDRVLAFCVSRRHAEFMAEFLREQGVAALAVHSGPDSAPRAHALERLAEGSVRVVCSVDMFNEGVDVPTVDTILMLRPTQSRILWLQQFGRGLRMAEGKSHLRVIDYIGNHRSFLDKPRVLLSALFDVVGSLAGLREAMRRVGAGEAELPPGCEVVYETEAIRILERLMAPATRESDLVDAYQDFRIRHGRRPTAAELTRCGTNPRESLPSGSSWFEFVAAQRDLSVGARQAFARHRDFVAELQRAPTLRNYEMVALAAMLELGELPGTVELSVLARRFERVIERIDLMRREWRASLAGGRSAESLLRAELQRAWSGPRRAGGTDWFGLDGDRFETRFEVAAEDRTEFEELVREIVEWRLAEHATRRGTGLRALLEVRGEAGRWTLAPSERGALRGLGKGREEFLAGGEVYVGEVGEGGVERLWTPEGDGWNALPVVLESWFADGRGGVRADARVLLERDGTRFRLTPQQSAHLAEHSDDTPLQVGHSYMREAIPAHFGEEFNRGKWHSGVVPVDGGLVLLVTLDKSGKAAEHRYVDRFASPTRFVWESQRKMRRDKPGVRRLREHREAGLAIHLFVRPRKLRGDTAAPFTYCGELDFVSWDGDEPITVQWDLRVPLSDVLWRRLSPG